MAFNPGSLGSISGMGAGLALGGPLGLAVGGGLGGILGGLFDNSQEQAMKELEAKRKLYDSLNLPEFSNYNPEDYQYLGDAKATTISNDPEIRNQQLQYLNQLAGLSTTGLSDVDQAKFEQARQLAGQISHEGTAAALQNAQSRGVAGSGLEFGLREQASQDAANRAQQAALDQAAQSAQQRALYAQAYGNALSGVRGQDYSQEAQNANILNQFNLYNTGQRQNVSNMNTDLGNQAQQYNNQLKQMSFQNALSKANGQSGAYENMANAYAAQNAANQSNTNMWMNSGAKLAAYMMDPESAYNKKPKDGSSNSLNSKETKSENTFASMWGS
jgi:hypothetical protein